MDATVCFDRKTGASYRRVGFIDGCVVLHDIYDDEYCSFIFIEREKFEKDLEDGEIFGIPDPFKPDGSRQLRLRQLSEKTREEAVRDFRMVTELTQTYPDRIFYKKARPAIFREFAEKYGVSPKTVRRKCSRYFSRGMCEEALYPDYRTRCNMKPKVFRRKPGKKTDNTLAPAEYEEKATRFVEKEYAEFSNKSLKTVHAELVDAHFRDENGKVSGQIPSYDAVKRIKNKISPKKIAQRRTSEISYFNNVKPVSDSCRSSVNFPMDLVQFDNTILPIYLAGENDRSSCVGKPTLSILVDVASEMILSINVSLQGCKYINTAYRTLTEMVTPFSETAEKYHLDPAKFDWIDIGCLPNQLMADKAELFSKNSQNVPQFAGIELSNSATGHARQKNTVEHLFDYYTRFIKENYTGKGAVVDHISERESRDYRKEACLTLTELTARLYMFTDYLNHRNIEFDTLPEEVFGQKVKPKPVELFRYGMRFQTGSLREVDRDDYRMSLLPVKRTRLSRKGIKIGPMRFVPDFDDPDDWILRKLGDKNSVLVDVKVNEMDLNRIYVMDNGVYVPYRQTTPAQYYGSLTWEEYLLMLEDYKEFSKDFENENTALRADFLHDLKEMDKGLKPEAEIDVKHIRENQKEEGKLEEAPLESAEPVPFEVFDDKHVHKPLSEDWTDFYGDFGFC